MEKYIEEVNQEDLLLARKKTVADAFDIEPDALKDIPEEKVEELEVAASKVTESIFDELWNDEMSLLEKINIIVDTMKESTSTEVVQTISKLTGMKFEEAAEVFENLRA